ncbi:MAG: acyltransferase, partial [Gloeobacterales cyanobacterium]
MLRSESPSANLLSNHPSQRGEYRPEIDGLRAFAVVAVIINHFNRDLLPSGFLGVDIFFVISGYVITSSLANRNHQSLADFVLEFYSRRIKRIVPALVLCVGLTCLIGFLFISPRDGDFDLSWQTGASSLFGLSNLYLLNQSTDYFATSSELNLFTQTWSLGVEEQFYFVFPLLVWFSGFGRQSNNGVRNLLILVSIFSVCSVAAFIHLSGTNQSAAYFLMPARLWELGAGCLLFLGLSKSTLPIAEISSKVRPEIVMILLVAALFIPQEFSLQATCTVVLLATALIATLRPSTLVYKTFTLAPVVYIGLISYSLYLWHWSVLAISGWTIGIHWWSVPIQVGLMLLLAVSSYRFVEKPLRGAEWFSRGWKTIVYGLGVSLGCAGFLVVLGIPLRGHIYTGEEPKIIQNGTETITQDPLQKGASAWKGENCVLSSNEQVGKRIEMDNCRLLPSSKVKRNALVIGNSFSIAEIAMYKILVSSNLANVIVTSSGGASPVREVPNYTVWGNKSNDYYWSVVIPQLLKKLRKGDVVIMVNKVTDFTPRKNKSSDMKTDDLLRGLDRFTSALEKRGIGVLFQSTNSFMPDAGPDFNCNPNGMTKQWFNLLSNKCALYSYSKDYTLK